MVVAISGCRKTQAVKVPYLSRHQSVLQLLVVTTRPWYCRTLLSALLAQERMCPATKATFQARSLKLIFWAGPSGPTMKMLQRVENTRSQAARTNRGDHSPQRIGAQGVRGMLLTKAASALDFVAQVLRRLRHGSQLGIGKMARFLATVGTYQESSRTCTVPRSAHRTFMPRPREKGRCALVRRIFNHRSHCWAATSNDASPRQAVMRSRRFLTMQVLSPAKGLKISSAKAGDLPIGRRPRNLARQDRGGQLHVAGGRPRR
mmetsp:Transcript_28155/g.54257  ORF Transcript_28155/g.54257 Transcript_28155/m.54257 type:complete len:261 (+) Transcript_28155:10-792(+)